MALRRALSSAAASWQRLAAYFSNSTFTSGPCMLERVSLDAQLQMNRQTWSALLAADVREGQAVQVDFFYFAPNEVAARALVADLLRQELQAQATSSRHGVFRRKQSWSVAGVHPIQAVSLKALDDMVRSLVAIGDRQDAEFDGWGLATD